MGPTAVSAVGGRAGDDIVKGGSPSAVERRSLSSKVRLYSETLKAFSFPETGLGTLLRGKERTAAFPTAPPSGVGLAVSWTRFEREGVGCASFGFRIHRRTGLAGPQGTEASHRWTKESHLSVSSLCAPWGQETGLRGPDPMTRGGAKAPRLAVCMSPGGDGVFFSLSPSLAFPDFPRDPGHSTRLPPSAPGSRGDLRAPCSF